MQVLLQKIDSRSRPIRKQERIISHNLKKKRILLDQENFDIISILKQAVNCPAPSSARKEESNHSDKPFDFAEENKAVKVGGDTGSVPQKSF